MVRRPYLSCRWCVDQSAGRSLWQLRSMRHTGTSVLDCRCPSAMLIVKYFVFVGPILAFLLIGWNAYLTPAQVMPPAGTEAAGGGGPLSPPPPPPPSRGL